MRIRAKRMLNIDENAIHPSCTACGTEMSVIMVEEEVMGIVMRLNPDLIIDEEEGLMFICHKCIKPTEVKDV